MQIASVASAFPPHYAEQASVTRVLEHLWAEHPESVRRVRALHESCGVEGRHTAYPLSRYVEMQGFGEFNDAWIEAALELGERALLAALERAGLAPRDVDLIVFSTVTGLAAPSIDARLMNRVGFRPDLKRLPLFGLGCVAGAAALARAAVFLRGQQRGVALVLTV